VISLAPHEILDVEAQIAHGELLELAVRGVASGAVVDEVFDAMVEGDESFVAGGVVVHNSEICQLLDGKVFSVEETLARWERAEGSEDPYALKSELPWVRSGEGGLWVPRGEERVAIGAKTSDRELAEMGVSLPPFHGLCRSTVSPVG
jgi:hypothetical protein